MPRRALALIALAGALVAGVLAAPAPAASTPADVADAGPADLLVRLRAGADPASVHAAAGGRALHRIAPLGIEAVRADGLARERYERDPRVAWVEPNARISIAATPDDPYFNEMWNLHNRGQNGGTVDADIDAPEAWGHVPVPSGRWTRRPGAVSVGVVDTGIDGTHPDLSGQVVLCAGATGGTGVVTSGCLDDNGHGTHVAGTIAAIGNDGTGVAGVAPTTGLAVCKALRADGSGVLSDIAACIAHLTDRRSSHRVRVISLSLVTCGPSSALKSAIDYATGRGLLVVAAVGNNGGDLCGDNSVRWPAGYSNVIGVGATDRDDRRASFSAANSSVEISAPGQEILSTYLGGTWAEADGTSMATPHVAAAAALIHERTGATGSTLRRLVRTAIDDLGPAGRDNSFGHGRLNLRKALQLGGYVVDGWGGLHPFRIGDGILRPRSLQGPYWEGRDIARGVATTRGGGYVFDGWGGIHRFRTGAVWPTTASGGPYWRGFDIVRGGAVSPSGGGYIVDGLGGIHTFATGGTAPPAPDGGPYWPRWDIVRGIALHPQGGGYLVDGWGGLHAFRTGGKAPPPVSGGPYWQGRDIARGVILLPNGRGGYVVDGWGGLHPFRVGSAPMPPKPHGGPYWAGLDIVRDVG